MLSTNFPQHRTLLDLHHYFQHGDEEIDVQFDVSLFTDVLIPYTLSSYRAADYQDKVPALAINILSKSTWRADVGENVDLCRALRIPVYIIFAPFDVASKHYRPPFARAYVLMADGSHAIREQRNTCVDAAGAVIEQNLIDLGDAVPFRVGIEKLEGKHEKTQDRFRLVIVRSASPERFLTAFEQEKQRAEQEKQRAEQEKQRAEQEKQRADKYLKVLKDHGIEP